MRIQGDSAMGSGVGAFSESEVKHLSTSDRQKLRRLAVQHLQNSREIRAIMKTNPKLFTKIKEIRNILKDASTMLQKNSESNGDADVGCNVTFSLKGPIRTFGSASTPTDIVDEQHRDAVHKIDSNVAGVDFHIKIVKEIPFCRPGLQGPFDGCSFPIHFRSIIVVDPSEHKDSLPTNVKYPDHLLWAHEFGHLTGLPHRHSK